ncbi:fused acetyl/propionyl-CoA carboxylase subuit alpha/methylmalonyl-CoA decarboxylase subunit alpha [Rhodococcus sp. WMMA185]|uniref:ATP-binding protein n=1 Tax=Rhodococcus sp. WMMA185 TaxID=679318 RepID=UPI0008782244|nr:carboxyl transferase domain-containing protein [Rhodococcus sp. WMMA185]AOW93696.1 fused acetyl/propionyl-CoA carboxylase subuit alpha/methylmalonyl-CoA decarboxylase subunit alpha [Rhodococcus sp. WMMA185]
MFKRIAIVNRGEAAVRLIRAVRELNAEHNYGIRTIALHTEAERRAMFVRQADEGVCLDTVKTGSAYLDHAELARALRESRADAVWVGWGFVAEDPAFVQVCEQLGITFIGPSAEAMRLLGDKVEAKLLAEKVEVPVAPWSGGPVATRADARRHAQAIGYPLIIKARSGGGGRGIRKVWSEDELELALDRTQGEAQRSFGDPVVFIERLVTDARHVEVQVIADNFGNVWAPGVRDCSIQRKNQKVIEESSSPLLTAEQSNHLRAVSSELVRAAGYHGAATVEYLYQPEQKMFTFLEVNTRLQVEHPITEATTGIDLVKLQILVASGEPLPGDCPTEFGHAIEARLNAEDAANGFAPAPGAVQLLKFPLGSGLRVDTGIAQGDVIPPDYDSMVAKVIAWGRDRSEALARLRTALRETTVVLRGGTTTKSFLLDLLDREEVISASADTGWLDRIDAGASNMPTRTAGAALIAAAIEVYDAEERIERQAFLSSARGGRPRAGHAIGRKVELSYQGQSYSLAVAQVGAHRYRVDRDAPEVEVEVDRLSEFESRLVIGGRRYHVVTVAGRAQYLVEVDGISHQISQDEAGVVRAPAPAVVVAVPVSVGDEVEAGATLVVLESMKMETAVRAPAAGRVREVLAMVNSQVDAGTALLRVEESSVDAGTHRSPRVQFDVGAPASHGDTRADALEQLDALGALLTGYDVSAKRAGELLAEYDRLCADIVGDPELVAAELTLLNMFADVCEIGRNRPTVGEEDADERVHSPREHFHTYLHTLDVELEGLPESFQTRLSRALRHYFVTDLERTPELEEAVYRLFLAQQRMDNQVPVIAALLDRWLDDGAPGRAPNGLAEVLDRLVIATQVRYPLIGNVARNVRFRFFDEPQIRKARDQVYDRVRGSIEYLAERPDSDDYQERLDTLIATPQPLTELLGQRIARKSPTVGPLLEVVTRRHYDIHTLEDIRSFDRDGRRFVTGKFEMRGQERRLVSSIADYAELPKALEEIAAVAEENAEDLVLDLYLSWSEPPADSDTMSDDLISALSVLPLSTDCRRVTVSVFGGTEADVRTFTFRPDSDVLVEEKIIRDMHPLTGQRFDLWRLKNFVGTRLPGAANTFVFNLQSRDNPTDERLIAFAEISDIAILRDEDGRVIGVPEAERVLQACLDGIRRAQSTRGGKRRLDVNRVVLYVWPNINVPLEDLQAFARVAAPLTAGAGLEEVTVIARMQGEPGTESKEKALRFSYRAGSGVAMAITDPPTEPLQPLDEYTQKVRSSRARGTIYPYELIPQLTGQDGSFVEHDLDESGKLVPVDRPYGRNRAGLVVGVVTARTEGHPEGMTRVALFGDPTKALGTVAEAECARLVAAVDLAEKMGVPVEWFALSSGATISMDSGTENMDWVSRGLRRLITFTQNGGEVNVIVAGINVGAQPYWNAEATMLMHTKGILVMTPDSAMVLTGKNSLDYSGGVSAEDNFGIGGYDRVMGPNGQAQYWAPNLLAACEILFAHYDHSYVAAGERFPRRAPTSDPIGRDVRTFPHTHPSSDFTTVGDIFSAESNPERKKPFDIRTVMRSLVDQDHTVLERWADMADADTSVVFDAHLGGYPVSVIGIESRAIPRKGWSPANGPDQWTAGTLFPQSSKKTARAINAASGNRPLVVLANLSGFDGSPDSLRHLQLEYGAEIGRAIVNFDGPVVFCVISRYHGGAFVVFSKALHDNMEVLAVEGSFASVLGGAPAAAVVFTREVNKRVAASPTIRQLEADLSNAQTDAQQAHLRVELAAQQAAVRNEKLGEVAAEFEAVHNIQRAQRVGSVDAVIPAVELRPYIIGAVERGMRRAVESAQ